MKPTHLLLFSPLFFVLGCASKSVKKAEWTPELLHGLIIEQDDPKILNRFEFMSGGNVLCGIGENGGMTASPIWNWSIDEEGRLLISDRDQIKYPPLELVEHTENAIIGKIADGTIYRFLVIED